MNGYQARKINEMRNVIFHFKLTGSFDYIGRYPS